MSERESGGDPSIYKFRQELTEPGKDGGVRGMSKDAEKYGHEPLPSAADIEAEAIRQEKEAEKAREAVAAS